MRYRARLAAREVHLELDPRGRLLVDGEAVVADAVAVREARLYSILIDDRSHEVAVLERTGRLRLRVDGRDVALSLVDEREEAARARGGTVPTDIEIRAPMPGLVVAVHVAEGDAVAEGASICTLEAMKMENEIVVPRGGTVSALRAAAGTKVDGGDLLAVVSP